MAIGIRAKQFEWHVTYPGPDGQLGTADDFELRSQLHVPVNTPVVATLEAEDVIHSFFVAPWRIKQDAVPGMKIPVWFEPTQVGTFELGCAELCGLGHSTMRVAVHVLNPDQYDAWFRQQTKGAAPAPAKPGAPANAAAGKQVFTSSGCASCHTLSDASASGTVGPNLNKLAADAAKYGKQLKETPEQYVKQSIVDPGKFTVPSFPKGVMPATFGQQLSTGQIDSLVKYLLSVGGK
jgi:cytochrome c oxidase subunit 2